MKAKYLLLPLIAMILSGCNYRKEKLKPEVDPNFSFFFVTELQLEQKIEVDHFVVGNDYLLKAAVDNRAEHSFAYYDWFTFEYDEQVFSVEKLFKEQDEMQNVNLYFLVKAKAASDTGSITVSYRKQNVTNISHPVIECTSTLSYIHYVGEYDRECWNDPDFYFAGTFVISSYEESQDYYNLGLPFVTFSQEFFETNSVVHMTFKGLPIYYEYQGYYIEGSDLFFRIAGPKICEDLSCYGYSFPDHPMLTTYMIIVGKADAQNYNVKVWKNVLLK